jgi:ribosomal-protein-alanine acetyltransferase
MINIRCAEITDLPALSQIEARCFTHFKLKEQNLRRFLQNGTASILVAELNNQICGHLVMLYRKNSSLARLYSIAIDGPYRQLQLGTQLLKEAERHVRERGLRSIILEVSSDNQTAKKFYVKHGFDDQKIFHNYYEKGLHAHRMSKLLQ